MSRPTATRPLPARLAPSLLAALLVLVAFGSLLAAGPRQVLSYADGAGQWVVRRVEASRIAPEHWSILARGDRNRLFERATVGRSPAQVTGFGGRLAMLFEDGAWSLASSGGVVNGPPLPDGRKALAIATIDGALLFLATGGDAGARLLRFDGNGFEDAGDAPNPTGDAKMIASRGSVFVADLTPAGVTIDARVDGKWRPRTKPVPADAAWLIADLVGGPALVTRDGLAWASRPIGRDGALGEPLAIEAGKIVERRDVGATAVGGELRLAWGDGLDVVEQTFDAAGKPVGEPIKTRPGDSAARGPSAFERGLSALSLLAIVLVLLSAGRRARADAEVPAVEPPTPAPVGLRAIAGLIDAWPLYVACGVAVVTTTPDESGHVSLASIKVQLILAAGVLAYILICFACERAWGRTAGKAIFGMRVVSVTGEPPTTGALAIRNGLRLLDLNVILLMMVPLSVLRQRLADLMAGTMVVDARTPAAKSPSKSADEGADK